MSNKHNSTEIKQLLKILKTKGFVVEQRKVGLKIIPPACIEAGPYFTHGTSSSYHNIRRDFASMYHVDVTSNCNLTSDPLWSKHV